MVRFVLRGSPMRFALTLLLLHGTAFADPAATVATAPPRSLLSTKSIRLGSSASPDGGWLSSLQFCDARPSRGLKFWTCTTELLGKDTEGAWQGDVTFDIGASYEIVRGLHLRVSSGMSMSLLFELVGRGIAEVVKLGSRGEGSSEMESGSDAGPDKPFPFVAVHFVDSVSLRFQRAWYFVDAEVSYHHSVEGSAINWKQPEGLFIGVAIGGSRDWITTPKARVSQR